MHRVSENVREVWVWKRLHKSDFELRLDALDILGADQETHARQRRLLSHAFSEKALREQEPILQFHVNKLMEQLSRRCSSGPLDLVAWYNFTSRSTRNSQRRTGQLIPYL